MTITILHWISFCIYTFIFGKAGLLKVIQYPPMMEGMSAFGFNKAWTLLIGYLELLGVLGLLAGIIFNEIKNASVIFLFPFSVGALMVHFAHRDYHDFYEAFIVTVLSVVLLATDKSFKIIL